MDVNFVLKKYLCSLKGYMFSRGVCLIQPDVTFYCEVHYKMSTSVSNPRNAFENKMLLVCLCFTLFVFSPLHSLSLFPPIFVEIRYFVFVQKKHMLACCVECKYWT